MSKFLFQVIFALFSCVAVGHCLFAPGLYSPGFYTPPANTCYSIRYKWLLQPGESTSLPDVCMLAKCQENGNISYVGCPEQVLPWYCVPVFFARNYSLPYPECCTVPVLCV